MCEIKEFERNKPHLSEEYRDIVDVRFYSENDYDRLIVLLKMAYETEITAEELSEHYIGENKTIIVATMNDLVIGCSFVSFDTDYVRKNKRAFVSYVVVDSDYRKKKIGTILFEFIEALAQHNKCNCIELTSANYRTVAHRFYESLNFSRKKTSVFIKELG